MTEDMERFTAYLSNEERDRIRTQAREQRTSENHVLRGVVRQHYGLDGAEEAPDTPERV